MVNNLIISSLQKEAGIADKGVEITTGVETKTKKWQPNQKDGKIPQIIEVN
jgi:uncharacterized protein YggU (UPF0235/DUF167 family)